MLVDLIYWPNIADADLPPALFIYSESFIIFSWTKSLIAVFQCMPAENWSLCTFLFIQKAFESTIQKDVLMPTHSQRDSASSDYINQTKTATNTYQKATDI